MRTNGKQQAVGVVLGVTGSIGQSSPREALTEHTGRWCLLSGHRVTQYRLAEDPYARWICVCLSPHVKTFWGQPAVTVEMHKRRD